MKNIGEGVPSQKYYKKLELITPGITGSLREDAGRRR
jgi:hypothetical protein